MRSLNHGDVLSGYDLPIQDASLLNFWQWAFSDVCDDDLKGIFAEWMIAKLLDISSTRRISWANSDLRTEKGVTIEVKAAAYWQSWKLISGTGTLIEEPDRHPMTAHKNVRFSGLNAGDSESALSAKDGDGKKRTYKSDLYFLAFQKETSVEKWDAMDMQQWEFYILRKNDLKGQRSVRLAQLQPHYGPFTVSEFVARAREAIAEVESNLSPR